MKNTFEEFKAHSVQLLQRKSPFPFYGRFASLSIFAFSGTRRIVLGRRGVGVRLFDLDLLALRVGTEGEAIDGNFEPAGSSTIEVAALNLCRHHVDCQLKQPRTYFRLDLAEVPGHFFPDVNNDEAKVDNDLQNLVYVNTLNSYICFPCFDTFSKTT